jgi:hypothetical protein
MSFIYDSSKGYGYRFQITNKFADRKKKEIKPCDLAKMERRRQTEDILEAQRIAKEFDL